ncbi:MAG: 5-formyltetrahydrofolate cyclo-ligase [Gammaproteobacteria bacterium]|nr:5-formyltetrahydrofolate cyclo-ligase [Gammaproteobacteria bacterium]
MTDHAELRTRNRRLRAELTPERLQRAADALCARLVELDGYRDAERIAAYFAVNGEIGLAPLIERALADGKQVFLPNLDREALRFAPYFAGQKMRTNRFRLPEPDVADSDMLAPESLDLVLAPLTVFDAAGNRIGMGGGFYDRSFAFRKEPASTRPLLVGVAHELQKVDRIEPEDWDVRLDLVVTDEAVYRG